MRWEEKIKHIKVLSSFCWFFVSYFSFPHPPPPSFIYRFVKVMIPIYSSSLLHIGIWTGILMLLNTLILGMKNNVQVCTYSFFEPFKHCYKALINFLRKYTRLNYLCSFHALVYELKVIFHTLQLACEAQHLMSYHFFCWGRNGMAIIF